MGLLKCFFVGCIFLTIMIDTCFNMETDLTVEVNAGSEHCFYQYIKKPTTIEVEYQVMKPPLKIVKFLAS